MPEEGSMSAVPARFSPGSGQLCETSAAAALLMFWTALERPDHGFVAGGAVVVDVGTSAAADGGLAGDVDPAVAEVAGALSPVPGGVGPVTTALLLRHVASAASPSGS